MLDRSWRRAFSSHCRRGLVKEESWRRGKTNKFNVEDEHYRNRLSAAVDKIFHESFKPDASTFGSLLKQCGNARALGEGRRVHARVLELGYNQDRLVSNFLVFMYGKCRSLERARQVFENMPSRNEFSYSILLQAFADSGDMQGARTVFDKMPLQAEISWTCMISGYARNGRIEQAEHMFERIPEKEVVAWTAMVTAYAQNGQCQTAFETFRLMDLNGFKPDSVAFISVLDACSGALALEEGRLVHGSAQMSGLDSDHKVANILIHFYGKCGCLSEARALFDTMPGRTVVSWTTMVGVYAQNGLPDEARAIFDEMRHRNVVSWNAMVAAYSDNGHGRKALHIFKLMDLDGFQPDAYTYLSILDACSRIPNLAFGRLLHGELQHSVHISHPKVGNALVNMYAKCGHLGDAINLFKEIPDRILAVWNSLIGAYAQTGHGKLALEAFELLGLDGMSPDEISFINVLSGCAYAGLYKDGLRIFIFMTEDYGVRRAYDHFVCAVNVLCQAGMLEHAEELVDNMPFVADEVPWITLLNACKLHKDVERARRAAERARTANPRTSAPYVVYAKTL